MIKDISKIREELKDHIEIELPYDFKKNCNIKYITLKKEEESFYLGGNFISYGNDSILLKKIIEHGVYQHVIEIKMVV